MARVRLLDDHEIDPIVQEFYLAFNGRAFKGSSNHGTETGNGQHSIRLRAHVPEAAIWAMPLSVALHAPSGRLTTKLKRLASLVTSLENDCKYCISHNVTIAQKHGVTAEQVDAIPAAETSPLWAEAERAVIEWSRLVTRNEARYNAQAFDRMRLHFSESEVVELTWVSAYFNMVNRLHDSLQLDLDDQETIEGYRQQTGSIADRVYGILHRWRSEASSTDSTGPELSAAKRS